MKRFRCACGKEIFFDNTRCLHCSRDVGFLPHNSDLEVHAQAGLYESAPANTEGRLRPCQNAAIGVCNWLIDPEVDGAAALCKSCRLTRVVPDLSVPENVSRLGHVESAKRRLLFGLMTLGVPVPSKDDDPSGLCFEILAELGDQKVMIGHANGVITIALTEADPVHRERERCRLGETYRTVLGHLRHEVGHFYFDRLIAGSAQIEEFRRVFGDERADYTAALEHHYSAGPPTDWQQRFVSAYASAHPWEDWAETWAHYLHACAATQTAMEHGVRTEDGKALERAEQVLAGKRLSGPEFTQFVEVWTHTATVMNELNRSLGAHEPYPFVLAGPVVEKLHFVHEAVRRARSEGRLPKSKVPPVPNGSESREPNATMPAMAQQTGVEGLTRQSGTPSPLRVLMIDDTSEFALPIMMSLESEGCQVRLCPDGASGLIAWEEFSPQVVLLDMELPDMHGLQLATTARSSGFSGVVIGLSAGCEEALMRRIKRSGLDDFLAKPCDILELKRLIAELLANQPDAALAHNA